MGDGPETTDGSAEPGGTPSEGGSPPKQLGPYEILHEIGRGGMGVVYKAHHPQLKRTVALKVLIAGEDASEEAIARFHREAESVAKLGHHPNIVPVHDIGRDGKLHYFAMHFVEGKPLDCLIDDGEIAPKRAAVIAQKLARALQHAHGKGILHRDIKPANVIMALPDLPDRAPRETDLTDEGRPAQGQFTRSTNVRGGDGSAESVCAEGASGRSGNAVPMLTDFGLAKDLESESYMTRTGVTLGSPQYMPPEQADGRIDDIDERSDIYALGATLYEMLTLHPPHEGANVADVIRKVLLVEPASPRRVNSLVAKDLDTICMKCLEKIPARRYGTASEVAGDLERYIAGEAILARPPGLRSRLTRKMARNKAVSVTLAAALAVLVCAGIVGAVLLSQGTKRIEEEKDRADRAEARESENAKVARVLLMAYSRLGDVHKELKRSIWDTSRPLQAKRELYRKYEGRIRDFQERVEKDPLSQATMLSVHGWLLRLGGFDEEAFEAFEKARATAPEVAPGYLFEAMVWLSQYLAGQPLPMFVTGKAGIEFEAVPAETPVMRKARLQFEAILDDLGKDALSGDETEAFGRILDGFRALHGTGSSSPADLETAEEGLTLALSQSTMGWLEAEILLARLKVRYLLKDFEGGLKDAERYLELCPGLGEAHSFLGLLQKGMGISAQLEGGDSRPWFEKATRSFSAALDARRDPSFGHASRGSALAGLARAEADRGLDPRENYRKAIEDFSRALDARPEYEMARNNRANALVALGREEEARGADPREHFRRAVRDLDGVLRRKPGFYLARNNRSIALMELGGAESKFGSDPRDHYRRAVEDATEAIRGDPDSPDAHTNRGNAYLALGRAQWAFGSDPGPLYGKALEDHGRALEMDPEFRPAYLNRGIVRIRFGEAEADRGRDPRTHYGKAVEDFGEVLKRNPRDSWALYQRGRAREALARWEEGRGDDPRDSYRCSLADFDDAVRLNPLSASIRFDRGLLHKSLGDQGASRGSEPIPEFLLALRDFDEALRLNPEKAAAYRERGIVHLRVAERKASRKQDAEREFQNALRDLDEAERRKPGNVLAISCRASARLGLGDVEMERNGDAPRFYLEAVADLDETLRLEPGHVNARNNRGNARFKLGDLDLMAGRDPIGQYEKALEDYSEAARRRSSHWQSRANKGLVLKRMGRYGEAAEILEEARRMAGGRHRGLQGWLDHARETEALPEWRRKLVLAADHLKRGGWASARALYEEGLRKGKEDSDAPEPVLRKAHYSLAQILAFTSTGKRARLAEVEPLPEAERSAQEVGALAHLRRALELGWNNIPYTRKDPNFEPIRERPEFEALLAEWEKRSKGK